MTNRQVLTNKMTASDDQTDNLDDNTPELNANNKGDAMLVYERDLNSHSKMNVISKAFAVMVQHKGKESWELHFDFRSLKEKGILVTSLHQPRRFSSFDAMKKLLNEKCPNINQLIIDLNLNRETA